jgi:hypothetical protein
MEGFVALEGYTLDQEVHTIFILSRYVEEPEISGGWVTGVEQAHSIFYTTTGTLILPV